MCVCVSQTLFRRAYNKKMGLFWFWISLLSATFSRETKQGGGRTYPLFPISFQAGGNGPFMSPLPTKLLMNWEDITTDHRDVPAFETTTWWFNNVWFSPFLVFVFVKLLIWSFSIACSIPLRWIFHLSSISKLFTGWGEPIRWFCTVTYSWPSINFQASIFQFAWNNMAYGKP